MAQKKFYLTTPIFYPNANLHLGHAYTTTLSDILVRYHRLLGEKTYFLTGSDENTQKISLAARAAGKDKEVFLNEIIENQSPDAPQVILDMIEELKKEPGNTLNFVIEQLAQLGASIAMVMEAEEE